MRAVYVTFPIRVMVDSLIEVVIVRIDTLREACAAYAASRATVYAPKPRITPTQVSRTTSSATARFQT